MSPCSDYFEELLDGLARTGMLAEEEWADLQPHVAQCPPCGMQLRSATRFQLARSPSSAAAAAADAQLDRRAIQAVILRSDDRSRRPVARRPSFFRRWAPIGVGTLLLSGTTLAATWWSSHREPEWVVAGGPEPESPGQPMAKSARGRGALPAPAPSEPMAPVAVTLGNLAPPSGWDDPSSTESTAAGRPRFAPHHRGPSAAQVAGTGRATTDPAAARLFARARHERVGGRIDQALDLYQRLQRGFPESRECRLSYLVAGRLWLERDRADLAAAQFRLYLDTDPAGGASEEALVGHASALSRMGRYSEEARDWRRLLTEHPGSIYVRRARVRLDALESKPVGTSGSAPTGPRLSP